MLITTLRLFYCSCEVLRGCSISVRCACTTGSAQIKTDSREVGRVKEKGDNEEIVQERTQKIIQAIFIDQPIYLQLLLRYELLNDTCFHPGHRFQKCMQVQLSSPKR